MQAYSNKIRNTFFENEKLSNEELKATAIALLITLISKGAALFPHSYAVDDYALIQSITSNGNLALYLSQGRFGLALLNEFLHIIGASAPLTNTLYEFIAICSQIFIGLMACRIWKISDNIALSCITILLIGIHPYQAEILTFKISPIYLATPLFLSFIAIYYSQFKPATLLWTSIFFMLSLSIYQIILNYVVIILAFAILLEMLRQSAPAHSVKLRSVADNIRLWPRIATVASGLVLYLIVNKIILYLFGIIPSARTRFLSLRSEDIMIRMEELKNTYFNIFFSNEPVLPFSIKVIFLFIFLLAFLYMAIRIIVSNNSVKGKVVTFTLVFSLILTALSACLGVLLIIKEFWPVPRVLSGVSIFWAGIVAAVYLCSGRKIHRLLLPLILVVLFAFAGINNHIFTDQLRVNMRDLHKANRIISIMEAKSDFSIVQRIAIVGGSWGYPSPILTAQGDMNISAFLPAWSKVSLLNELSGYNFTEATEKEQNEAIEYCKQAHKWPNSESVSIKNELCIVCL